MSLQQAKISTHGLVVLFVTAAGHLQQALSPSISMGRSRTRSRRYTFTLNSAAKLRKSSVSSVSTELPDIEELVGRIRAMIEAYDMLWYRVVLTCKIETKVKLNQVSVWGAA